jgi:hypothetical protein
VECNPRPLHYRTTHIDYAKIKIKMSDQLNDLLRKVESMLQTQNGNLNGGYLSITNGKYRIIIDILNPTTSPRYDNDPNCTNTGTVCAGSNNWCHNAKRTNCSGETAHPN